MIGFVRALVAALWCTLAGCDWRWGDRDGETVPVRYCARCGPL